MNKANASVRENQQRLRQSQAAYRQFQTRVRETARRVTSFRTGMIAATAAVVGLTAAIRSFGSGTTELISISDQIGEDIETVQRLQRAFAEFGFEVDVVNDSLREISKRLVEADRAGTGTAFEALELLGLHARNAEGNLRSAVDILRELGGRTELTTRQLTFFFDEFGGGRTEELVGFFASLRREGLSFDQALAKINNTTILSITQAERLSEANRFLIRTWRSFTAAIQIGFAEALGRLNVSFEQLDQFLAESLPRLIDRLSQAFDFIINNLETFRAALFGIIGLAVGSRINEFLGSTISTMDILARTTRRSAGALVIFSRVFLSLLGPIGLAIGSLTLFTDVFSSSANASNDVRTRLNNVNAELERIGPSSVSVITASDRVKNLREEAERLQAQLKAINDPTGLQGGLVLTTEQQVARIEEIRRNMADIADRQRNLVRGSDEFRRNEERALELSREQTRLREQLQNRLNQIRSQTGAFDVDRISAQQVAEAINQLEEALPNAQRQLSELLSGTIDAETQQRIEQISNGISRLGEEIAQLRAVQTFVQIRDVLDGLNSTVIKITPPMVDLLDTISQFEGGSFDILATGLNESQIYTQGVNRELSLLNQQLEEITENIDENIRRAREWDQAFDEVSIANDQLRQDLEEIYNIVEMAGREHAQAYSDAFRQQIEDAGAIEAGIVEQLGQIIDQVNADVRRFRERQAQEETRARERILQERQRLEEQFAQMALARDEQLFREHLAQLQQRESEIQQVADGFGSAFGNFARGLATDFDDARDLARRFVLDLRNILIDQAVFNPVKQFFSELIGGLLQGASGPGGLFGGLFGGARQSGGPVNRNQIFLVGEQGPELFRPSTSGTIIPNNQIRQNSGGNTFVYNISGSDAETVRRVLQEESPFIADVAGARTQQDLSRFSPTREQVRVI